MEKIFGIDLGTTNSEIAWIKDGKPEIITVDDRKRYLPSVVGIDSSGKIITGFPARNQYVAFPENTVVSIKRKMGSGEKVTMGGKEFTPAQISSEILKTLKKAAEKETGTPVKKVVITVPAYFTDIQRKDTIDAGELAGLEVVRIINEPTAAALAYGCRENSRERLLVYDLGGGTFDVSLIDVEEGVIEVLATDGNSRLGGDDFDIELEKYFNSLLPGKIAQKNDLKIAARLKNTAESTKIILSTKSRVDVKEEFIATLKGKPINLELSISREEFENRIGEKLSETFKLLETVLKNANVKREEISKILLVGGSTHIPIIFNTLGRELGFDVHREIDPTYCVAQGAAIQGSIISGEEIETILVDVNSHSLGIKCLGGGFFGHINDNYYSMIIHRNTPIPASMTKNYYTLFDNQKAVEIKAFQGEDPVASGNTFLGSFVMDNLPKKLPAGSEIEVTFEYNLNGIVEITAFERESKRKEKLKVDVNRLDIKEMEERPGPAKMNKAKKEINRKKINRVLNSARKKLRECHNSGISHKLKEMIDELDKVLDNNEQGAEKRAQDLARFIAEI